MAFAKHSTKAMRCVGQYGSPRVAIQQSNINSRSNAHSSAKTKPIRVSWNYFVKDLFAAKRNVYTDVIRLENIFFKIYSADDCDFER